MTFEGQRMLSVPRNRDGKRCSACRQFKPWTAFGLNRSRIDGYSESCFPCRAFHCRRVYQRHGEQRRRWQKEHSRPYDKAKRKRLRGTLKEMARDKLRKAVKRGEIKKPARCQGCGKPKLPKRLQGHHPDYSKPLEVIWLCSGCHSARHRKYGEQL
jgi:hypothetical protein